VRTLLLFALPAIAITVAACADVTIAGTGGSGGSAGSGGSGGSAGTGGSSEGATLLPEPVLSATPQSFAAEPPSDSVDEEAGVTNGQVSGACPTIDCTGTDPVDQWRVTPTMTAEYRISLTWAPVAFGDLDLYLVDSNGNPLGQSATAGTTPEIITATLAAGLQFTIQVQAFDTNSETQPYTLEITATE
jgi:hypothetical protein